MGRTHEDPSFIIQQKLQDAMRALREAEDYARGVDGSPEHNLSRWWRRRDGMANRIREVHELLTERCIQGRLNDGISWKKMRDVVQWVDMWAWNSLERRHSFNADPDPEWDDVALLFPSGRVEMKYLVASSARQADLAARELKLRRSEWRLANKPEDVRGASAKNIILVSPILNYGDHDHLTTRAIARTRALEDKIELRTVTT